MKTLIPSMMREHCATIFSVYFERRWVQFVLLACAMTLLSLVTYAYGQGSGAMRWAAFLDRAALDGYFSLRGQPAAREVAETLPHTRDIVLVETSHAIPRPILAKTLDKLRLARVVALDLMFVDQEGQLSDDGEREFYRGEIADWHQDNRRLAASMRAANNVVLGLWPEESNLSAAKSTRPGDNTRLSPDAARVLNWERPPLLLWNSARYHSHLLVQPDSDDDVVRRVALFELVNGITPTRVPCFGLALAAAAQDISPDALQKLRVRNGMLQLGTRKIPVERDGTILIDYVGDRTRFENGGNNIVYQRVLDLWEPEDFKDKIVIVGEVSRSSKEIFTTPYGEMPGVQLHANILATLLSANGPPTALPLGVTGLIALGCSLLLIAPLLRLPLWASLLVALLQCGALLLLGAWIFLRWHRVLPLSVPIVAIALTYNAVALYEYRRTRQTLGRFIGQEMVPRAMSIFSPLHLGGEVEDGTAFFCDLRGYSTLSEKMAPENIAELLNEYTGALVQVARQYGGRPIDFQGDGAFILFDTQFAGSHHQKQAVRAALDFNATFAALREQWTQLGAPELEIGIGIDTGPMMIGMVGSEDHLKIGAVGDVVNVAARIQALSQLCGHEVLITRAVRDKIDNEIPAVSCGMHHLRGRHEPVEIFGVPALSTHQMKDANPGEKEVKSDDYNQSDLPGAESNAQTRIKVLAE